MKVIVKWSDGIEEVRDLDVSEAPAAAGFRRFRTDAEPRLAVHAGRLLNGTPIYYEDSGLGISPLGGLYAKHAGEFHA